MIEKIKGMKIFTRVLTCVAGGAVLAICAFAAFATVGTTFGKPEANRQSGSTIAVSGDTVMLSLDATSVEVLNAYHADAYSLTVYASGTDSLANVKASDDDSDASAVTVTGDTPMSGVQYTTYLYYSVNGTAQWPSIYYSTETNATETVTPSIEYQYGTRVITREGLDEDGYTYTVTYTNPDEIALAGDIGDEITLATMTDGRDLVLSSVVTGGNTVAPTTITDSATATFLYTVTGQTSVVVAYPTTSMDSIATVDVGDSILLVTEDPNTMIFYTTDNSEPSVVWDTTIGNWWVGNTSTQYYSGSISVPGPIFAISSATTTLTINAVAITKWGTGTVLSDMTSFTYLVNALPQADVPTISPTTSTDSVTALADGSEIYLSHNISGGEVFYTIDGTYPDVEAWISEYVNALGAGITTEAEAYAYASEQTGVYLFDVNDPIIMQARSDGTFTVKALVVDFSTSPSYSMSDLVTYTYTLATVSAVTASPNGATSTSKDLVSVVENTLVSLTSGTEDATIYYEMYYSVADLQAAMADHSLTASNGEFYNADTQITIRKECWVRAVAVKDGVYSSESIFGYAISDKLAAPTASLPSGSVVQNGSTIALSASGDVMYTTDGTDPRAEDSTAVFGNSIVFDGEEGASVIVRAYVTSDGYTPSDTVTFTYTICAADNYLQASPVSGETVQDGDVITLVTSLTGAEIYYTTDGTTPTVTNSLALYQSSDNGYTSYEWSASTGTTAGSRVTVSGEPGEVVTIKAVAMANGATGNTTSVFTYTFAEQTPAPTASIPSGAVVLEGATVTLTASEGDIYYTTDGSDPTNSSALYTEPIAITTSTTLKIRAYSDGKKASEIVEYVYTRAGQVATPVASVPSGTIEIGTVVALTTTTENATIYYSTDGTDPTADNYTSLMFYDQSFAITRSVTIKMMAVATGLDASEVVTITYTVVDAPEEEESTTIDTSGVTSTDRLVSRRDYSTQEDGPSYSDVVLQDSETLVIVSADNDAISSGAVLGVSVVQATSDEAASAKASGYEIVSMYEVTLTENGLSIVPSNTFEVGLPIAADSYNASMTIAQFTSSNADMQTLKTRRSGGYGYVQVDEVARYAVVMPLTSETVSANVASSLASAAATHLPLVVFVSTVALVGGGCLWTVLRRRAARQVVQATVAHTEIELPDQDDPYANIDSFFHV